MIRTCTFRDYDIWFKADRTGHNKVGVITRDDLVIYPVRRHFRRTPLREVAKSIRSKELMIFKVSWPKDREDGVEDFFASNVLNPGLMRRGINSLFKRDFEFFEHPVRLPVLGPLSPLERRQRWGKMLELLKPGDLIQVFDQSSVISRLIARVDQGIWSHSAGYAGGGIVMEAITSGVVARKITVYDHDRYRLGVYRVPDLTDDQITQMLCVGLSHLGAKYSWRGLFRIGIKKLLRLNPEWYREGEVSPNDLVGLGVHRLVHIV